MADLVHEEAKDDPIADVRAAMAQLSKGDDEVPAAPVEPDDAPPDAELAPESQDARKRGPDGKFIKTGAADGPATADITTTTDSPEVKTAAAQPAVSPPTSWSSEAKAEWAKLPPAIQTAVIKREREVSDGFAQKSTELRPWKEIEAVIAPRRSHYQRFGFKTDAEAVNHLFTLSDSMERDPAGTLAFLAQHYGLTSQAPQIQNGHAPAPQQLPDVERLVDDKLSMAFARQEIEEFKSDKDKYPHFDTLRPLMSHLLTSGQAKDLAAAYESALWATPDLRQSEIDRLSRVREETARTAQTQRTVKAKQATRASLTGAPHGSPPRNPAKNSNPHDDAVADVRAAMEQLGA